MRRARESFAVRARRNEADVRTIGGGRTGGCFCERLANGGGIEHARVLYVQPGQVIRMAGALGPLQAAGVAGSLTLTLAEAPGGAKVTLAYGVGGFVEGGFEKLAPLVDGVLGEQLQRFKAFVEK